MTAKTAVPAIGDAAAHADPRPDDVLVNAARSGDSAAFEVLIQRYSRFCFAKAYSVLRDRADAEDEVQNTWAKVWARLWQYTGEGSFVGWMSRILANQCLIRIRDRRRARLVSVDEVHDHAGMFRLEIIDQRSIPEDALGETQVESLIQQEIRRLPKVHQRALVLRDLQHKTMEEIAGDLGVSVPAAKSRLMRGRIELRKRIEARHTGQHGAFTLLSESSFPRAAYIRAL
jgi:RNA polymerase sigma-70 factor (ECF subfamily)